MAGVFLVCLGAVLVPVAAVATVVAYRRRIAERLGIAPPGYGDDSAGDPDEDLGPAGPGDEGA